MWQCKCGTASPPSAPLPSRSQVRRMRSTISPRLAMKSVRIGTSVGAGARSGTPWPAMNASNATDATRHRPPTRLAGSWPLAIQRWTDLVVVPMRAAAWLGLSSSSIGVAIVAFVASEGKATSRGRPSPGPAARPGCASNAHNRRIRAPRGSDPAPDAASASQISAGTILLRSGQHRMHICCTRDRRSRRSRRLYASDAHRVMHIG